MDAIEFKVIVDKVTVTSVLAGSVQEALALIAEQLNVPGNDTRCKVYQDWVAQGRQIEPVFVDNVLADLEYQSIALDATKLTRVVEHQWEGTSLRIFELQLWSTTRQTWVNSQTQKTFEQLKAWAAEHEYPIAKRTFLRLESDDDF